MAYLDIDNRFAGPAPLVEPKLADGGFTALEWNVIALARRDSLRSLSEAGPLARAMGGLFGRGTSSRLADGRLEALRRVAVYAWRRGFAIPKPEIARFLEAGFAEAQLERMVESITGWRVAPKAA